MVKDFWGCFPSHRIVFYVVALVVSSARKSPCAVYQSPGLDGNDSCGTVLRFPSIFTWTVIERQQGAKDGEHTLVECVKR